MSRGKLFVENSSEEEDENEELLAANELTFSNSQVAQRHLTQKDEVGKKDSNDARLLDDPFFPTLAAQDLDDLQSSRNENTKDDMKVRAVSDEELENAETAGNEDARRPTFDIKDIKPVDVQLSITVPFQQLIVQDMLVSEDPLLIMGKGLGTEVIVASLLYILSTPTNFANNVKKQSLVLLLNCTAEDNLKFQEEMMEISWLSEDQQARDFYIVSSETSSIERRRKLYLQGGIISVTSRILIVDILSGIIDLKTVTGLMILHVESLTNYCNISFITEMYREVNKWGFIKGISDSATSFVTKGFQPLHSKLKQLKLKNPILWPRFHVQISQSLNNSESKVIEVRVAMTENMTQIQFGIYECLKKCLDELNRKTTDLEMNDYWTLDNVLDSNFMRSMAAILEPQWHRISFETKQLVKDVSTLRKLLSYLLTYDALDFYEIIKMILEANKPSITRKYIESLWLLCDESQLVISNAKRRVSEQGKYVLEPQPKWEQLLAILDDINYERSNSVIKNESLVGPTLIMCSSNYTATQLSQIINLQNKESIRKHMMQKLELFLGTTTNNNKVRKAVKDLKEKSATVHTMGPADEEEGNEYSPAPSVRQEDLSGIDPNEMIDNETNLSVTFTRGAIKEHEKVRNSKRRRTRGAAYVAAVNKLKDKTNGEDIENLMDVSEIKKEIEQLGDYIEIDSEDDEDGLEEPVKLEKSETLFIQNEKNVWESRIDSFEYVDKNDQIVIEKFFNKNSESVLEELMPSYIILYEPDLHFVRKVELYRAVHPNTKIYFMYYRDSAEEQHHLTEIKLEKEAFSKLIKERVSLAKHFETDEDLSRYKNLVKMNLQLSSGKASTRIAGGQNFKGSSTINEMCVVVDTREFNASLPGLLYRYGVKVIPCMLTVGDYILTPNICVERKSISDLIGSLKNGRLVDQCKKMTKHYKHPTLLVEFSDNQSFSLEPFSETRRIRKINNSHPIGSLLMQDEIQRSLAKLVMRFPSLAILWSSSPLQTVNIILDLKQGREEPDPQTCVEVGKKASKQKTKVGKTSNTETSNESLSHTNSTLREDEESDAEDLFSAIEDENNLKKLLDVPGLANVDYYKIVSNVRDYNEISKMSLRQLADIIGDIEVAERVSAFIRNDLEK
ncbi:hypothetical protein ACO0RG_002701 [Hanseniaspora osmophila]